MAETRCQSTSGIFQRHSLSAILLNTTGASAKWVSYVKLRSSDCPWNNWPINSHQLYPDLTHKTKLRCCYSYMSLAFTINKMPFIISHPCALQAIVQACWDFVEGNALRSENYCSYARYKFLCPVIWLFYEDMWMCPLFWLLIPY